MSSALSSTATALQEVGKEAKSSCVDIVTDLTSEGESDEDKSTDMLTSTDSIVTKGTSRQGLMKTNYIEKVFLSTSLF